MVTIIDWTLTYSRDAELSARVAQNEHLGAERRDYSLGIQCMPEGYALMINSDRTHYYWLCRDGRQSSIDWDKWRLYRGAKYDAAKQAQAAK